MANSSRRCDLPLEFLRKKKSAWASQVSRKGRAHPPVAKFHAEDVAAEKLASSPVSSAVRCQYLGGAAAHVQVRLRDVKDGVPCVETLVEEAIKILGKAELIEDVRQVSHTVVLCLANTSRVCREERGALYIGPASRPVFAQRQIDHRFAPGSAVFFVALRWAVAGFERLLRDVYVVLRGPRGTW